MMQLVLSYLKMQSAYCNTSLGSGHLLSIMLTSGFRVLKAYKAAFAFK